MINIFKSILIALLVINSHAATLSKGHTFGATDEVTSTKLNNLVDNGSISNIEQADMKLNNGVAVKSSSNPSDTDAIWLDSGNSNLPGYYDGSNWVYITDLDHISTNPIVDALLDDVLEDFISGCYVYRVDGDNIGVTTGSAMINGNLRRITSAITNVTYSAPDNADWLDIWILADASATTFTAQAVDSGTSPGGSSNPGTNGRLVCSIKYIDGTTKISQVIQYRDRMIFGWGWIQGNNTEDISETVTLGVTLSAVVEPPEITLNARHTSAPTSPTVMTSSPTDSLVGQSEDVTTTNFLVRLTTETGGTLGSGSYYGYRWEIKGEYS